MASINRDPYLFLSPPGPGRTELLMPQLAQSVRDRGGSESCALCLSGGAKPGHVADAEPQMSWPFPGSQTHS